MKIIKKPEFEFDEIDIYTYGKIKSFNPYNKDFLKRTQIFVDTIPGRHYWTNIIIDFEDEIIDPETFYNKETWQIIKRIDINIDNTKYEGIFPIKSLGNNIWECSVDNVQECGHA